MADAAYKAWRADRQQGLVSVLIAETRDDGTTLNARALADLILDGTLRSSREVELNDGSRAGGHGHHSTQRQAPTQPEKPGAQTIRNPQPGDNPDATVHSVLCGFLQHVRAELSAHETIDVEQNRWGSIAQLAAEYETIAAAAQQERWASLIRKSGLTAERADVVIDSDAFGALTAELRRAEANNHNVDVLLPKLVRARGFADVCQCFTIASRWRPLVRRAPVVPARHRALLSG